MGKKNSELKKVRKLTFLHGQVDKVVTDLKTSDGKEMVTFFTDLIVNHPEYACDPKRGQKMKKEKEKKEITSSGDGDDGSKQSVQQSTDQIKLPESKFKNPLREEMFFGLTEIMKKIQNKQVIGVIANDPLTIHLQATLHDLCKEFDVPFLLCKNLNQIGEILKLSKLSCCAFSEKVKETNSMCHPLYKIFLEQSELFSNGKGKLNPCLLPKDPNKEKPKVYEPEFLFDFPPEEKFYIPREEINDSTTENPTDSENKLNDFISINQSANHFPPRRFFREIKLTIPWIGEEQKKTTKIGKTLFVVKSSLEKVEYPLDGEMPFSEPKTIQLPASGRIREKRKKFKKTKQQP